MSIENKQSCSSASHFTWCYVTLGEGVVFLRMLLFGLLFMCLGRECTHTDYRDL